MKITVELSNSDARCLFYAATWHGYNPEIHTIAEAVEHLLRERAEEHRRGKSAMRKKENRELRDAVFNVLKAGQPRKVPQLTE